MKRFVLVAVTVGLMLAALASTALAAPAAQANPGNGIHTPGTGPQAGMGFGRGQMAGNAAGAGIRRGGPEWAGQPDEVQALLGMTDEQIQAERLSGKSLAQIAAARNVGEQKLIDTILAAKKATLDKLVGEGKLAQAQADYAYSRMQAQVKVMVGRTTTGPSWSQGDGSTGAPRMGRGRLSQ